MRFWTVIALFMALLAAPVGMAEAGLPTDGATDCVGHVADHEQKAPAKPADALCCAAFQIAMPTALVSATAAAPVGVVRVLVDSSAPARVIEPAVPPPRDRAV